MDSTSSVPWNLFPGLIVWRRVRFLGSGSYGAVYLTFLTNFNELNHLLAVKTSFLALSTSLFKEKRVLANLGDCPEIIVCFGHKVTVERGMQLYNLVLEYAPFGTLSDLIQTFILRDINIRIYTTIILKGLRYMHAKGYVHCDLKPDNILVFPSDQRGCYRVKIADFGLTKEPDEVIIPDDYKNRFRGTPCYMSPESVVLGQIGPALDIWSLGCIVIEMHTAKSAWHVLECTPRLDMVHLLASTKMTPPIPCAVTEIGRDFLRKCLARDPRERWTARMLLNHPYVSEV
ncbi:Mitogen-activated protein kinase kinase kinase 2 [Morus notabilis]|uniref:Mitogen-activated protein kinase kinase kinase 2 n=1 Tax=Morus notabilis TaxID=981085 RepID=W9QKG0_9ROSA|nr:mitogen-activated protein kinase kinase kinase 17 [Morus notabilis]EXB39294.1 Mitogen-activated protein kinase kinase kinase 2 [Morus notabilis]